MPDQNADAPTAPTPGALGADEELPASAGAPAERERPGPRVRDRLLWVWPVVLIVALAVLGQYFGSFGVLLAGTGVTGVIVLFVGVGELGVRTLLIVLAVTCAAITAIWFAHSAGALGPVATPCNTGATAAATVGPVT